MTINGTDFLAPDLAALLAGPARARPRRRVFPGHPAQVGCARQFVRRILATSPAADDAALLTSELAANAIQHTASNGTTFQVVVCHRPTTARIAVIDAGAPTVPTPARSSSLDVSGRGLALVEALAAQWGHQGNRHGRVVWFDIDCP
jgi:anti-sigma regulatory factor (Ser/Thr protein kinase)